MDNIESSPSESSSNALIGRAGWFWASWTLAVREVTRFLRQRSRLIGAVVQPLMFWILFGAGLSGSFSFGGNEASSGMSFQEYFLPGIAVMIVLFTSIFSAISVIQDKNEGFLQGVLVAPIPRSSIVMGKVLGGTVLAMIQALLFVLMAPLLQYVGLAPEMRFVIGLGNLLGAVVFLALVSLGLTALGYFFAWKMDSVQGYHSIMSVVLLPMWLLSGALFPGTGSPWMKWIIALNPLTYGVAGLRRVVSPDNVALSEMPSMPVCLGVTLAFAFAFLAADVWVTRRDQVV